MHLFILVACGFLSIISALIYPMRKPDGSLDITSLLNHVTLLEQNLQTKTNQLETEIQSTKTELSVTKVELEEMKTDFKSHQLRSTAEITSLKDELAAVKSELTITSNEVISVKSDVTILKKESVKSQINFTFMDSISNDVKSNVENLKHLQTDLHSVKLTQDKTNTSMESFLTTLMDVNETTADIQKQQTGMKTDISKCSSLQKQLQSNINSTVHDVSRIKDNVMTVQSQLITTKDDIGLIKTDMATLENEARTLKDEHVVIKTELLNISSALNQIKSSEVSTVGSVNHIKGDIRTVQSQLSTTTGDINQIRFDMTALGKNISTLEMMSHGNSQSLTQLSQTLASKTRDVAFQVFLNKTQDMKRYVPVIFDHVHCNAGDGYNTATGKFTAPVSGTYIFHAQAEIYKKNTAQGFTIFIVQSGSFISGGFAATSTDKDDHTASTTAITSVKQGEQVYVEVSHPAQVYSYYRQENLFSGAILFAH